MMFAVKTFTSEFNLFAAKECAKIFERQPRFNFIFGNDEVAEICICFQFQIFRGLQPVRPLKLRFLHGCENIYCKL